MFQDYALFVAHGVGNVEFGLRYGPAARGSTASRATTCQNYIDLVGLAVGRQVPHQLSGACAAGALRASSRTSPMCCCSMSARALDAQTRLILQDELLRIWGQDRPPCSAARGVHARTPSTKRCSSDRVAVMRRIRRLKALIDIDLPRPRNDATRALPKFQALSSTSEPDP